VISVVLARRAAIFIRRLYRNSAASPKLNGGSAALWVFAGGFLPGDRVLYRGAPPCIG
jgi:hypothetical protein